MLMPFYNLLFHFIFQKFAPSSSRCTDLRPPWGEQFAGGLGRRIMIPQRLIDPDSPPDARSLRGSLDRTLRRGSNVPEVCRLWAAPMDVAEWLLGLELEQGGIPRWSAVRRCRAPAADGDVLRLIGPTALSPAIVYGGFTAGFDTPISKRRRRSSKA